MESAGGSCEGELGGGGVFVGQGGFLPSSALTALPLVEAQLTPFMIHWKHKKIVKHSMRKYFTAKSGDQSDCYSKLNLNKMT